MSDENKKESTEQTESQQPALSDELDTSSESLVEEPDLAQQPSSSSKAPWIFALLLALVALALAAGVAWLGHQQAEHLQTQLEHLQVELDAKPSAEQLNQLASQLDSLDALQENQEQQAARWVEYQDRVREYQKQTQELHQDLLKASEPRPRDWQLAEVEYLLRLAGQRLQLEEDIAGALTLFKTAEQRLQAAEVPGTLSIRQSLQDEIAQLDALPSIDRVSLALELQGMADRVLTLQVQPLGDVPTLDLDQSAASTSPTWYLALWQEIKSLIVIRQRELPIESLPFAEEEQALRHQISSLLQQASWAALRAEQDLYQQSLAGVERRLAAFDLEQPQNQAFADQLARLQEQQVVIELPSLERSLDRLQTFISERYGRPLPLQDSLEMLEESTSAAEEASE